MKLSHALAALIIAWFAVFGECCSGYRLTERHEADRWVRCGVGVSFTDGVQPEQVTLAQKYHSLTLYL